MANINKIKLSGTTYNIQDANASKTVELTQAQYDALVSGGTVDPNTFYIITDATAGDLSNYYTKSETSGATEISTALGNKQDTLVSSTNIKTINNQSILGEGNIEIQGGGSSYTGVSGITINENNEIYYNGFVKTWLTSNHDDRYAVYWFKGDSAKIWINDNNPQGNMNYLRSQFSFGINNLNSSINGFALGQENNINGFCAGGLGEENTVNGNRSLGVNYKNKTNNSSEFASGQFNNSVSASTTFGDSGNTLFSVGNGTSDSARHNAFEIRQNGDIYITKDGADVKLQDQLGGGGSSYTAGDGIDITNDVISVTGKVDTSTYNTYTAATDTALASKQTTLTAGTGISIVDNVISATGGTSITIDPSLDSGSTNPVANSAITEAITTNQNAVFITSENRNSIVEHIENDIYELKTNDIYSISFIPKDLEYTKFRFTCYVNGTYTDVETDKNVDTATTQISITFDSETNRITVTSLDRDANKIDVFALRFFVSGYGYKDFEVSDVYITHNPSLGVVKTEYEKTIQTSYKESGGYITERKGNTEIKYNTSTTSTSNLVNGSAVNAAINKVKTRFDGFGQSYKGGQGCTNYASQSPNITDFTSGEHSVTLNNTNSARVWWFNVKLNENSTDTFGDLNINFSADGTSFGNLTLFLQMNTLEFRLGDLIKRIDVTDKTQTYSVFVPNGILVNTSSRNAVASYNVWSMTEGEPFFIESIGIFDIPQDSSCLESFDEWKSNVDTDISNLSASTRGAVDMTLNHINDSSVHVTSAEKSTWDAKSDFSGDYNDLTNKPTIPTVPTSNTAFTNDAGYITIDAISGKVDTSTYNTYTAATDTALASKQTTLTAGTGISIVDNVISATGGGGGMTEDDELLLSTALTDLNDRKIDASEVKSNYQKKGDYVTTSALNIRLAEYETALDEQNVEEVTAYALNDLNNKFGGLSLVKITESEYAALATKDENTLYIVVADPSQTR